MNLFRSLLLALCAVTGVSVNAIEITFGPYLQQVGTDEAVIVWGTNDRAVSWVEIAPDDTQHFYAEQRHKYYQTQLGRKVIGTLHRVQVTGLKPGTTYRYRVFSQAVTEENSYQISYGPVASTRVYKKEPLRFTTIDPSRESIRFSVVNDMHADTAKIGRLLRGVRNRGTDFVIFNGDMVSVMDSEQQVVEGFINKAVELFASEIPFYMGRGNHEGRGVYATHFPEYFPSSTGMPYYTFRHGPVFFVVMDGGEDKPDDDIEYFGLNQMDSYREREAEWLREVIASEEFRTAPYRVVMLHVPPMGDTWHGNLHIKDTFLPILNGAGVDLMLCGHFHRHLYIPEGSDAADFPIVVNSNVDRVDVESDGSSLRLSVRDDRGNEIMHRSISPRR